MDAMGAVGLRAMEHRSQSCLTRERAARQFLSATRIGRPWVIHTTMTYPTLRDTVRLDLLVPVQSNAGTPFNETRFHSFEEFVVDLTGGVTRLGEVEGLWRNGSGLVQREFSRMYSTVVPATDAPRVAAEIDRFIRDAFDQEAAFVTSTPTFATAF